MTGGHCSAWTNFAESSLGALYRVPQRLDVYFEKIRVLKAGVISPNNGAWNNGIGPRFYFVGFRSPR